MTSYLAGPLLKIERAKKHIADLDSAIRSFCDSEPYTLTIKNHPEIEHIGLEVVEVAPIPNFINLIIGDAVHNLRSAFDHLNCRLIEAGGGTPKPNSTFPICKSPEHYASALGKGEIGKMRPGTDKLIQSIQPYMSGDSTLWHIHALDRVDKHRLILTVTMALTAWIFPVQPGWEVKFDSTFREPLEAGQEIFRTPVRSYHPEAHKNIKLGLDITFGKTEIVAGKPVLETLNGMVDLASAIIRQFEPFLL
jgi:hypothetical protein